MLRYIANVRWQISDWVESTLGFAAAVHGDGRDVSPKRPAGVVAHFVKVTDCHHVIEKPTGGTLGLWRGKGTAASVLGRDWSRVVAGFLFPERVLLHDSGAGSAKFCVPEGGGFGAPY